MQTVRQTPEPAKLKSDILEVFQTNEKVTFHQ